jgi:Domain of unknown function (DUF4124)
MQFSPFRFSPFLLALGVIAGLQPATAQVFKCQTADGKVTYSQAPCNAAGGKEQRVEIKAPPPDTTPAAKPNHVASTGVSAGSAQPAAFGGLRKSTEQRQPTTAEIVADCEKNRGTRCNTAAEINQRRIEQTPLSREQQRDLQQARAARAQDKMSREMMRR